MSNLNLNKVILCGRLTNDPELKTTQSQISVVSFTLAVNRRQRQTDGNDRQQTTDFISCVAWRQNAEFITKYFKKGSALCITGSIQVRKWTDQQGANRYSTEVVVDEAMFVDAKSDGTGRDAFTAGDSYATPGGAEAFDVVKNEDDLPF
jgi:single-strand DNA-binding protein